MEWYNVFNKGIPSERYMGFTLDLIGHNCSTNNAKYIKAVTSELVELNERIKKETKFDVGRRVSELHKVKSLSQLEKEFPTLYNGYKKLEQYYSDRAEMRKKYAFNKKLGLVDEDAYNRNLAKYNKLLTPYEDNKHSFNVKTFVESVYKKYSFYLKSENYQKIISIIKSSAIDMRKFDDCLDKEKFELIIACSCLSNAYLNPDDAISYISYLTQYFREHENDMDSDISVELHFDDEDKTFTRQDLYKRYKEYLITHPEVKIVRKSAEDFEGQTLEDVMAYLDSFKGELEVSWDILPSGEKLFERIRILKKKAINAFFFYIQ